MPFIAFFIASGVGSLQHPGCNSLESTLELTDMSLAKHWTMRRNDEEEEDDEDTDDKDSGDDEEEEMGMGMIVRL